jgi:hypothetical protein
MSAPPKPFSTESSLHGPRAMDVLDEAVSLLRQTPLTLFSIYYLGALPFCLALIYFYFDMTQSADAANHLPGEALLLTVLYFWMKTCQAVFARKLLALLEGDDAEAWNLPRLANTALLQIIYAGSFALIYPVSLVATVPFGWVNAFYHNISIVATGLKSTVRSSLTEAAELSRLWPKQNHLILGIVLLATFFLFANLAVFFLMIPSLLNMFFGIMTVFDENGWAWNNSSFYLDVMVFCFLILNPFNKAVHVLRCFYGRARLNGADLKAELRRQRRAGPESGARLAILAFCSISFLAAPARADNTAPATPAVAPVAVGRPVAANLDHAIQKTLQKDEFAWRLPRKASDASENEGILARTVRSLLKLVDRCFDWVGRQMEKFMKWLFGGDRKHDASWGNGWKIISEIPWRLVFVGLLLIVVGCLIFLLLRHFRHRPAHSKTIPARTPIRTVDLEADDVRADALPEDSWLLLAQQLLEKGEFRLALRALYLATLSVLAHQQLVRLGPAKSNRDYLVELTRRSRGDAVAVQFFRENIRLFEASWYGTHAVTSAIIETMRTNHQQVRSHATT